MSKRSWSISERALALSVLVVLTACGRETPPPLATAQPGLATEGKALLVAVPLVNAGEVAASEIRISGIRLADQRLIRPAELPLSVAEVPPGGTAVLQLAFESEGLEVDRRYALRLEGDASFSGSTRRFHLEREVTLPPADVGERAVARVTVETRSVDGGAFEPAAPAVDLERINRYEVTPLPEGLEAVRLEPHNPPVAVERLTREAGDTSPEELSRGNEPITFLRVGTKQVPPCCVLEPSGQSVDVVSPFGGSMTRLVVLSGNFFHLLVSTDGGSTYSQVQAPAVFGTIPLDDLPKDVGFCCDNNVVYIPSIDRIVWQLLTRGSQVGVALDANGNPMLDENGMPIPINGSNRLRIATASPEQLIASGGTAWSYWDMTTALFGFADTVFLDFPSLAYSKDFLYVSASALNPLSPGQDDGFFVAAVPLSDVKNGGVIHIGHTFPKDGRYSYSTRLAQDCSDAGYWFGHEANGQLRVYEWMDGAGVYSWRTLAVGPWVWETDDNTASLTPEGINWLTLYSGAVRSATCQGFPEDAEGGLEAILAAWSAGRDKAFPQPHVRLQLVVKGLTTWTAPPGAEIWNPEFAFQQAHLATNANGEVGVSVAAGGGTGGEATAVTGFVGDATLYAINVSTWSDIRWGDYTAIRPHWPNDKLFSVSDYFLLKAEAATALRGLHQYRLFGRSADVDGTF